MSVPCMTPDHTGTPERVTRPIVDERRFGNGVVHRYHRTQAASSSRSPLDVG